MSNIGASISRRPKRNIKVPERYSPILAPGERLEDDLSVEEDALSIGTDESLGGKPIDDDGEDDGYEIKKAKKDKYIKDEFVRGDDEIEYEEGANDEDEEEEESWGSSDDDDDDDDEEEEEEGVDDDDEEVDENDEEDEEEWSEVAEPQFSPPLLYYDSTMMQGFHANSESSLPGFYNNEIPIAISIPIEIPTATPVEMEIDSQPHHDDDSPNPANQ